MKYGAVSALERRASKQGEITDQGGCERQGNPKDQHLEKRNG